MKRLPSLPISALLLALALALPAACTRDLVIGANEGAPTADGGLADDGSVATDSGTETDGAPRDASPDAACGVTLVPGGAPVAIEIANEPYVGVTPSGEAPLMVAGTYDLIAYKVFWGGKVGTGSVRETLVITGSPTVGAIQAVSEVTDVTGQIVARPLTGSRATFEANGVSAYVRIGETCPGTGSALYDFGYDGAFFVLADQTTAVARLFRRR